MKIIHDVEDGELELIVLTFRANDNARLMYRNIFFN